MSQRRSYQRSYRQHDNDDDDDNLKESLPPPRHTNDAEEQLHVGTSCPRRYIVTSHSQPKKREKSPFLATSGGDKLSMNLPIFYEEEEEEQSFASMAASELLNSQAILLSSASTNGSDTKQRNQPLLDAYVTPPTKQATNTMSSIAYEEGDDEQSFASMAAPELLTPQAILQPSTCINAADKKQRNQPHLDASVTPPTMRANNTLSSVTYEEEGDEHSFALMATPELLTPHGILQPSTCVKGTEKKQRKQHKQRRQRHSGASVTPLSTATANTTPSSVYSGLPEAAIPEGGHQRPETSTLSSFSLPRSNINLDGVDPLQEEATPHEDSLLFSNDTNVEATIATNNHDTSIENRALSMGQLVTANLVDTIEATCVVREEDLEGQLELDAQEIAKQLLQQRQQKESQTQRRRFFRRLVGCTVIGAVVLAIVIVLITNRDPNKGGPLPSSNGTIMMPNISVPSLCADFPCQNNSLTVLELVQVATNHTLLSGYLQREEHVTLRDYLASNNNTLLAPTDESFRALQRPHSFYLNNNSERWRVHLSILLATHIIPKRQNITLLLAEYYQPTLNPKFLLTVNRINLTLENGVSIVTADIPASNGYIQIPDQVVFVPALRTSLRDKMLALTDTGNYRTSKFRTLLQAARGGVQDTLDQSWSDGLTLFVPEDTAFASLDSNLTNLLFVAPNQTFIQDFLSYHVAPFNLLTVSPQYSYSAAMLNYVSARFSNHDNATFVNSAQLVEFHILQNGFLHIIDQVLLPPNDG